MAFLWLLKTDVPSQNHSWRLSSYQGTIGREDGGQGQLRIVDDKTYQGSPSWATMTDTGRHLFGEPLKIAHGRF